MLVKNVKLSNTKNLLINILSGSKYQILLKIMWLKAVASVL